MIAPNTHEQGRSAPAVSRAGDPCRPTPCNATSCIDERHPWQQHQTEPSAQRRRWRHRQASGYQGTWRSTAIRQRPGTVGTATIPIVPDRSAASLNPAYNEVRHRAPVPFCPRTSQRAADVTIQTLVTIQLLRANSLIADFSTLSNPIPKFHCLGAKSEIAWQVAVRIWFRGRLVRRSCTARNSNKRHDNDGREDVLSHSNSLRPDIVAIGTVLWLEHGRSTVTRCRDRREVPPAT